jgi:hypothetical protein
MLYGLSCHSLNNKSHVLFLEHWSFFTMMYNARAMCMADCRRIRCCTAIMLMRKLPIPIGTVFRKFNNLFLIFG